MSSPQPNPANTAIEQEMEAVYRLYVALAPAMDPESGLGGKLLYAGEPTAVPELLSPESTPPSGILLKKTPPFTNLKTAHDIWNRFDPSACHLLRAANISGAASLSASAHAPALHQAMRAGAIDFVVTTLGEALRILKNEIRKKQPVAVGVLLAPQAVEREMLDRGVQPDLLAPGLMSSPQLDAFAAHGARRIQPQPLPPGSNFNVLPIPPHWRQPLAAFDELLLGCLASTDHLNRRWVRLAPRYLGSETRRLRSVACPVDAVLQLIVPIGGSAPEP